MAYPIPDSSKLMLLHSEGGKALISPGPPEIGLGPFKGGWLTRPNEGPRTPDQIISFRKFTVQHGKRDFIVKMLVDGIDLLEKSEPGTLSILVVEDESNEDVAWVFERFRNTEAVEAHMNNPESKAVAGVVFPLMVSQEGGLFKAVAGFVSKDE
jgi:quinol monooxygenase YgiN